MLLLLLLLQTGVESTDGCGSQSVAMTFLSSAILAGARSLNRCGANIDLIKLLRLDNYM